MSTGGKGSKPRPFSVPKKKFDSNWDAIFKPKKKKNTEPACEKCGRVYCDHDEKY